jgi:hypothetical protein
VDVVLPNVAPLEVDLTFPEHPVKILDQKDRVMRRKMIKLFMIQWTNHSEEEATWESEDFLHSCLHDSCVLCCHVISLARCILIRISMTPSNMGEACSLC